MSTDIQKINFFLPSDKTEYPVSILNFVEQWKTTIHNFFGYDLTLYPRSEDTSSVIHNIYATVKDWNEYSDIRDRTNHIYKLYGVPFFEKIKQYITMETFNTSHYKLDFHTHPDMYDDSVYIWTLDFYLGPYNLEIRIGHEIKISIGFSHTEEILVIDFIVDSEFNILSYEILASDEKDYNKYSNLILDREIFFKLIKACYYNGLNKNTCDNDGEFNQVIMDLLNGNFNYFNDYCLLKEMNSI